MGKAFDATGSYEALLITLAIGTFSVGALMLRIRPYESRSVLQPARATPVASGAR